MRDDGQSKDHLKVQSPLRRKKKHNKSLKLERLYFSQPVN